MMATGDQTSILGRLRALLPPSWFPSPAPALAAVQAMFAAVAADAYAQISYARLQMRIGTVTDIFVDLTALDFLGRRVRRKAGETDSTFRARIKKEVLRERVTRNGVQQAIIDLTDRTPIMVEPTYGLDTGGYNLGGVGYGAGGAYGSLMMPYQAFITAYRPATSGIPLIAGYGVSQGGYGQASRAAYGSLADIVGSVTDEEIYATIADTLAAGTTAWVRIQS